MTTMLENLRVVLTHTTLAANIGGVARAMMTMGLSQLVLVKPKQPIDETSYAHAKGGGVILDKASVVETLDEALADCHLVIATSARNRSTPRPMLDQREAAELITNFTHEHKNTNIALVFGREDRGLTNHELSLAHYHLAIRANPAYPVLNLASSVQVVASYLYEAQTPIRTKPAQKNPINHTQKQVLDDMLLSLFDTVQLNDEQKSGHLLERIRRLTAFQMMDSTDYKLTMALLYQLQKRLATPTQTMDML